jgi:hypothetical protein
VWWTGRRWAEAEAEAAGSEGESERGLEEGKGKMGWNMGEKKKGSWVQFRERERENIELVVLLR